MSILTATAPDLRECLTALFDDAQGLLERRALPSRRRLFIAPDDRERVAHFVAWDRTTDHVRVGVATRRETTRDALFIEPGYTWRCAVCLRAVQRARRVGGAGG